MKVEASREGGGEPCNANSLQGVGCGALWPKRRCARALRGEQRRRSRAPMRLRPCVAPNPRTTCGLSVQVSRRRWAYLLAQRGRDGAMPILGCWAREHSRRQGSLCEYMIHSRDKWHRVGVAYVQEKVCAMAICDIQYLIYVITSTILLLTIERTPYGNYRYKVR